MASGFCACTAHGSSNKGVRKRGIMVKVSCRASYPTHVRDPLISIRCSNPRVENLCAEPEEAMKHEIEAVWVGKMRFNALVNGHTVVMDAPERAGGEDQGPIPKPFMLTALAGCTGMDIVGLLRKQGTTLDRCDVKVTGEINSAPPIVYTSIHVTYDLRGKPGDRELALSTVQRSQNELCGVSSMLKRIMPVTWEVAYNGELVLRSDAVSATA